MQKVEKLTSNVESTNICDTRKRVTDNIGVVRLVSPCDLKNNEYICVNGQLKGSSCEIGGFLGIGNRFEDATCPATSIMVTTDENFKYCINKNLIS